MLDDSKLFFFTNRGLRILLRLIQIIKRNTRFANFSLNDEVLFEDVANVLEDRVDELKRFYGEGGAVEATRQLLDHLKRNFPERYSGLEEDLRKLRARRIS